MQLIATRRYPISDIDGKDYTATDTLYRLAGWRFELRLSTDGLPGEPDSVQALDPEAAFEWLDEVPEQIEHYAAHRRGDRVLIRVLQSIQRTRLEAI
jgi:hypothetical protein